MAVAALYFAFRSLVSLSVTTVCLAWLLAAGSRVSQRDAGLFGFQSLPSPKTSGKLQPQGLKSES